MLTDTALKNLRPKARAYKSTDRDGMYVYVSTGGAISFRYDYRFNGRRETMTLGRYGRAGLTLAQARERLIEVKKAIADGVSPAVEKQRAKRRLKEAHDFAQVAQGWMDRAPMADSTRDMRRAIFNRDILPKWKNRLLSEITPDDLRAHCKAIVDRGAPATAIHVRDIVKQIYGWAILHGEKIDNPADDVGPASIATFRPRDRSLTPAEIRIMLMLLGEVATLPTIRLGLKFILLSMVRKSELQDGVWTEVDFDNAVWSIPAARMKRSRPHNVYLSTQMLDILVALKTCAGNSKYILPSRYDADAPMSRATFNRVTSAIAEKAGSRVAGQHVDHVLQQALDIGRGEGGLHRHQGCRQGDRSDRALAASNGGQGHGLTLQVWVCEAGAKRTMALAVARANTSQAAGGATGSGAT